MDEMYQSTRWRWRGDLKYHSSKRIHIFRWVLGMWPGQRMRCEAIKLLPGVLEHSTPQLKWSSWLGRCRCAVRTMIRMALKNWIAYMISSTCAKLSISTRVQRPSHPPRMWPWTVGTWSLWSGPPSPTRPWNATDDVDDGPIPAIFWVDWIATTLVVS